MRFISCAYHAAYDQEGIENESLLVSIRFDDGIKVFFVHQNLSMLSFYSLQFANEKKLMELNFC